MMEDQQIVLRAWRHGIGATLIIAELSKQGPLVELLNDRADLPAGKPANLETLGAALGGVDFEPSCLRSKS